MKSSTLTCITAISLFAALSLPTQLAAQKQTQYTVTFLGTLGGTFSFPIGMNNKGEVVGVSQTALPGDIVHAFLWRKGLMTDLGTLGGQDSAASFPAESGEVSGVSDTSTPDPNGEDFCGFGTHLICLPFLWKHGVMTSLPTLGGNNAVANSNNDRVQVVGQAENTTPDPTCVPPQVLQAKPAVWEKGEIQELPTFPGDPDGGALAINDEGQAVGGSGNCATPNFHALLWQNGTATDLGNLGGTMNNIAAGINNQRQVVGASDLSGDTTRHAFLWEGGVMTDLGTLPGDVASLADSINSKSQVTGGSFDASGNERAFLWQNGAMTDLNTLVPGGGSTLFLFEAFRINDRGQIGVVAFDANSGDCCAFLLTPTNGEAVSADVTGAAKGQTGVRPTVVVPESVRKMLRQRLAQRYHIPGLGAPRE